MMPAPATDNQQLTAKFLILVGCYFSLHIILRVLISDSLDYDEAEQALLGQWLLAGYTEQPPLYTWIQYFLFKLFGKNVFAISLLKNSLLFLTYVFVFLSSQKILRDSRAAILATCSLLLIPQIAWESQRDMTHTTLVVFAASATLWQAMRLLKSQTLSNYCLLGLLLGIGILAKANFALFLIILLLSLVTLPEGRKAITSPKTGISILIIAAISGTYFLWMYANQDIVFSVTHKFERAVENYRLKGTISLFTNSFLFLTPLWLICLLCFPTGYGRNQNPDTGLYHQFIKRYLLLLFLVILTVVLLFKVSYVKDRWLQPLLFVAPIFFFSRFDPHQISPKRFKLFLGIVSFAAVAVYITFTLRVTAASYMHSFCRLNYPFSEIAEDMRSSGFSSGLIISDNRFLAGNMHFQFPDSVALIPDYRLENLSKTGEYPVAAVIWKADLFPGIPAKLSSFLKTTYSISPSEYPVKFFEHRYKYGRTETAKLAVMQFPVPEPSAQ